MKAPKTYKEAWDQSKTVWEKFFNSQSFIGTTWGRIEEDTAGNKVFIESRCSYCSMSTGRTHEMWCLNYRRAINIFQSTEAHQ